jgi:hypothetical protein
VKFYRDQPRTLTLGAWFAPDGDELVADCRLTSLRQLANQEEPQATTHFTGRVRLTREPAEAETQTPPPAPAGGAVDRGDLYRVYFHGPAYQVVERAWRDGDRTMGLLAADLPGDREPAGARLLTPPRLVELCFQTAGVRELGTKGLMGLPERVGRVRFPRGEGGPLPGSNGDAATRLWAVVRPAEGGTVDADVVDDHGTVYVRLESYGTVELPSAAEPETLEPLRAAMA